MPSEVLSRPHWVAACVQQWAISQTLDHVPYADFLVALRSLPHGAYHGIALGTDDGSQTFVFLHQSRICGVRVSAGELRGWDALSHISRVCESMTWEFRQAPEPFTNLVPIMAGLVGEGGKQLVRQIEPTMSAHLQTLADLEKNACMYLVVEQAGPAQTEWILLSTGQGQIHRIGVSETNVELPTHSGLDASTLMTVFRRQKATDELYRVIPRYFSDEALASMAPPIPAPVERPEHLETPSAQRRSTSALVYLLPVVVALVAWGGWVLRGSWTANTHGRTSEESPQPALTPAAFQTERPSEPSAVRQLQSEVASLKVQLGALRSEQQAPSTPLAERSPSRRGTERPDTAPTPARDRRLDSLTHRIAYLEEMIHGQSEPTEASPDVANRAGKSPGTRSEIAPVEAAHSDAPSQAPGQPATPSPLPPATEHPFSQQSAVQDTRQPEPTPASPLQARAYADALVDTPPVLVSSPAPEYPTRLRRLRIEGDVLVSLLVSADGQVAQVVPLRGRTELRQAAAEGIRRWRYEPARLNGAAVPCWTTASIAFRVP